MIRFGRSWQFENCQPVEVHLFQANDNRDALYRPSSEERKVTITAITVENKQNQLVETAARLFTLKAASTAAFGIPIL